MKRPTHGIAYEVLCLQIADGGRGDVLLGGSASRARHAVQPFLVGDSFPSVYFEFPLIGDPFLDVTLLYNTLEPGARIASEAAAGTEAVIDWYARECSAIDNVSFGFELDTKDPELPSAAIHFQPREHLDLVEPFCEAVGEPERARLYLDLAARMPERWPLSFFGMFRGRPGSPLRVCGYLGDDEKHACASDEGHVAEVFETVGFTAYDSAMVADIATLMALAPETADFQFDVYPDGTIGDTFAIDVSFGIARPEVVHESFETGACGRVLGCFEEWGMADGRWKLAADVAFARALPAEDEDGSLKKFGFSLVPQWVKARWRAGVRQPSKLYYLGSAKFFD